MDEDLGYMSVNEWISDSEMRHGSMTYEPLAFVRELKQLIHKTWKQEQSKNSKKN